MYPLFESIKTVDGVLQHLEWHQQRVDRSFMKLFGEGDPPDLSALIRVPDEFSSGVVKTRFTYGRDQYNTAFTQYTPRSIRTLKLVSSDEIVYDLKYNDRSALEKLFSMRGGCDDVLIVRDGLVTDTSYCNVVFYRGGNWYTPALPLLEGTCRNRLLAEGTLLEADISVEEMGKYEKCRLINAMLDFEAQPDIHISDIYR